MCIMLILTGCATIEETEIDCIANARDYCHEFHDGVDDYYFDCKIKMIVWNCPQQECMTYMLSSQLNVTPCYEGQAYR